MNSPIPEDEQACIDGAAHDFAANSIETVYKAINTIDYVKTVYCRKCLKQFELPRID